MSRIEKSKAGRTATGHSTTCYCEKHVCAIMYIVGSECSVEVKRGACVPGKQQSVVVHRRKTESPDSFLNCLLHFYFLGKSKRLPPWRRLNSDFHGSATSHLKVLYEMVAAYCWPMPEPSIWRQQPAREITAGYSAVFDANAVLCAGLLL